MFLEDPLSHISLDFESGRNNIVLNRKRLRMQMDILNLLKTCQIVLPRLQLHVLDNLSFEISILKSLFLPTRKSGALRKVLSLVHVWNNYGDKEVLERVSIDEDLLDYGTLGVDVLQLLWRNVLSLGKLEDVLSSVYDLEATVREDHANVA
jgi:hypothetical protein